MAKTLGLLFLTLIVLGFLLAFVPLANSQQLAPRPAPPQKIFTKRFIAAIALTAAAQIADVETTAHAGRNQFEANTLYAPHPGRPQLYAIHMSVTGAAVFFSYAFRREGAGKASYVPLIPVAGMGVYAAVHNGKELGK